MKLEMFGTEYCSQMTIRQVAPRVSFDSSYNCAY